LNELSDPRQIWYTAVEDGPFQRMEYKVTPKWAWSGARDPISKFWDPLITFEGKELSA